MKKIMLTSALCASMMFAASNPSDQYGYELTIFTSGILTDTKSEITDDNYFNGGISLSKNLESIYIDQVEIGLMRSQNLELNGNNGSTNSNRYFVNAVKKYALNDKLAAYGLAGVGFQNLDQELNDTKDSAFVNYGIGLRYDIPYYGIALKSDIRHLISTENSHNDVMYTFGLAMPLGKKAKEEVIAPVVPTVVEEVEPVKEVKKVQRDDDNDGVINRLDKCPGTSPGVKVNAEGCVAVIDLKINFESNSSTITDDYNSIITEFANILKENKKANATIEAHTDSRGSDAYNEKLSQRRADSAVKALEEQGIEPSRLKAVGYGEKQPIATNTTSEGRAQNRRVTGLINQ